MFEKGNVFSFFIIPTAEYQDCYLVWYKKKNDRCCLSSHTYTHTFVTCNGNQLSDLVPLLSSPPFPSLPHPTTPITDCASDGTFTLMWLLIDWEKKKCYLCLFPLVKTFKCRIKKRKYKVFLHPLQECLYRIHQYWDPKVIKIMFHDFSFSESHKFCYESYRAGQSSKLRGSL